MTTLTLTPAIKDYKTAAEVREAWAAGKDFRLQPSGVYCSIRDLETFQAAGQRIQLIQIRYNRNSRVTVIKV